MRAILGKFNAAMKGMSDGGKAKILLVEDDDALAEVLAEQLALHEEFELSRVETAAAALAAAGKGL